MKRFFCCLLLLCLLPGCAAVPTPTRPTEPFSPTLLPPEQTLAQAVEKTAAATSFHLSYQTCTGEGKYTDVFNALLTKDGRGGYLARCDQSCGCGLYVSGSSALKKNCANGEISVHTADKPYGITDLFADLPQAANTDGIIARFCSLGLTASPSNTGITRFEVWDLSYEQLSYLVTGNTPSNQEPSGFLGFFAFDLNVGGYLTTVEFSDPDGQTTHRYTVTRLNHNFTVGPPDWTGLE